MSAVAFPGGRSSETPAVPDGSISVAKLTSGEESEGRVAKADGAGGVEWGDASGGGGAWVDAISPPGATSGQITDSAWTSFQTTTIPAAQLTLGATIELDLVPEAVTADFLDEWYIRIVIGAASSTAYITGYNATEGFEYRVNAASLKSHIRWKGTIVKAGASGLVAGQGFAHTPDLGGPLDFTYLTSTPLIPADLSGDITIRAMAKFGTAPSGSNTLRVAGWVVRVTP